MTQQQLSSSGFKCILISSFLFWQLQTLNNVELYTHTSIKLYFCSTLIICFSLFWFSQPFSSNLKEFQLRKEIFYSSIKFSLSLCFIVKKCKRGECFKSWDQKSCRKKCHSKKIYCLWMLLRLPKKWVNGVGERREPTDEQTNVEAHMKQEKPSKP